jgi:hydrogenase large subunit
MTKKIISPITRINGFWKIDIEVENGFIVSAKSSGIFYRGMEQILLGRDPRDAVYLTQRICGICSTAHGIASSVALEEAFKVTIPKNAVIIRNIIFGADLLQNHIRHFYLLHMPDFMRGPDKPPFIPRYKTGYRIPRNIEQKMFDNYLKAIDISRKNHEMVVLFGGKIPHNHGILAGGASVPPDTDKIRLYESMLNETIDFIDNRLLGDMEILDKYYPDYNEIGVRPMNMFDFGMFPKAANSQESYLPSGLIKGGKEQKFETGKITEHVRHSWFKTEVPKHPQTGRTEPTMEAPDGYSWVKAPRYDGRPMETGPIARMWLSGDYRRGVSTMDRMMARVKELHKVSHMIKEWLKELEPGKPIYKEYEMLKEAEGVGTIGAMRGGLGHWIKIYGGRISHYQIITPSAWNCSPQDDDGNPGPVEESLIGSPVDDIDNPIEVGRIVRAYDPCLACAVHAIDLRKNKASTITI